jgi:hypothetical protein
MLVVMMGCGGGLTDEQRKKIKNEMEITKIKRVSEAEITEAAYAKGREVTKVLTGKKSTDSIAKINNVKIKWIEPGKDNHNKIEDQLIEAYLNNIAGENADNVQRLGLDSLLYTMPILQKNADGVDIVKGMWGIYLSRKQLVLDM